MSRTIAYIRQKQQQTHFDVLSANYALERQREALRACKAWFELELIDTIIEAPNSPDTLQRPGLQRALALMTELEARRLLVLSLAELSTSGNDLKILLDSHFSKGFILYCGAERLASNTAHGWAELEVKSAQLQLA